MELANIPVKFPIPFANSASATYSRPIPELPQPDPAEANLTQGFTPINFDPVAAGGVPPSGKDFNGLFKQVTQWLQWTQAGGGVLYFDPAFAADIGGYPEGAFLQSTAGPGNFWISTVDNNSTNPDTGGANWTAFPGPSLVNPSTVQTTNATFNFNADTQYSLGLDRAAPAAMTVNLAVTGVLKLNQIFEVEDLSGNLSAGKVTIVPPSGLIAGAANFVMNKDKQSCRFKYYGGAGAAARWSVRSS